MRAHQKSLPSMWAQLFGFFVLALILSTAECRSNRVKAQEDEDLVLKTRMCDPVWLEQQHGENWHLWFFLNGCWMGSNNATAIHPRTQRRFVIGGSR